MEVKDLRERRFRVGQDPREWTVKFTQNAIVRLDDATKRPLTDLLQPGVVNTQWLLWGGLEGARLASRRGRAGRSHDIFDVGDLLETIYSDHEGKVFDLDQQREIAISDLLGECFLAASRQIYHVRDEGAATETDTEPDSQDPTDGACGSGKPSAPDSPTSDSGT